MDLSLILNLDQQNPAARRVLSAPVRSFLDLPPLIAGDTYTCLLKGIDANGAVYTGSGASGYLPRLRVSYVNAAGAVVLLAAVEPADFTRLQEGAPAAYVGWTFRLPLTTAELLIALPDGAAPLAVNFELTVTDPTGYVHTWYRKNASIQSRLYDPTGLLPVPMVTLAEFEAFIAAAEAAQAAAESARDLSLQYRDATLAARDDAQAAQSAANLSAVAAASARDAAITARDAAQAAQSAAEAAQAAATTQAGNALASANAAAASQAAALASQNAAAASAAAALASEAAAAASAAAALISQNAAAASAVTAAATVAAQFLGGVAGNAVPATATAAGYYYRVTSAGTSQGKTWAVGDMAIYNGTSGSWTQLAGILPYATEAEARAGTDTTKALNSATGNARALLGDITRRLRDSLYFDGATAGARAYAQLGSAGAVGLSPKTIIGTLEFPPSALSATTRGIFGFSSRNDYADITAITLEIHTYGNDLYLILFSGSFANYRNIRYANAVSTYFGQTVPVALTSDAVGAPVLYLNGQPFAGSETTGGAVPAWSADISDDYFLLGVATSPSQLTHPGRYGAFHLINGALTAAEVLAHAQTGRLPAWCDLVTGSMVNIITNGNFSAGSLPSATGWAFSVAGTSTLLNTAGVGVGGTNAAVMVIDGSASACGMKPTAIPYSNGQKIRLRFTAKADAPGATLASDVLLNLAQALTTSFATYEIEGVVASAAGDLIKRSGSAGRTMTVDDIQVIVLGPVAKWFIQPGGVTCSDSGDNKIPLLITPGVTAIGEKPEMISVLGNPMAADGFVLADQVISPVGYELIAVYLTRLIGSGTGTVTIKETSSGGTTIATGAIGAGTVALTVSNGLLAGGKKHHLANSSWSSTTIQPRFLYRRAT